MNSLKIFLITIFHLILAAACSIEKESNEVNTTYSGNYALLEIDSYSFRRAYHGHDTLDGVALEVFMNRNPEGDDFTNSKDHIFYAALCNTGLFLDGNLNLSEVDTLPDNFSLQLSQNHFLKVKTTLLQNPKEVKTPSYELTFTKNNKVVLIDTLAFDWPPDVTFLKSDLDHDGTDELLTIFRWYFVNGDNFDMKIFKIKHL